MRDFRVFLQVFARIVLALADLVALVAVPGAGLFDQLEVGADLDKGRNIAAIAFLVLRFF